MKLEGKELEELTLADFLGPNRVSSWIPRKEDIKKILGYTEIVGRPRIVDIGCGNGLASYLLESEGADVLGVNLRLNESHEIQMQKSRCLRFRRGNAYSDSFYQGRNVIYDILRTLKGAVS